MTAEIRGGPLAVGQLGNVASGPVSGAVPAEVRSAAGKGDRPEVRRVHDSSMRAIGQEVNLNLTPSETLLWVVGITYGPLTEFAAVALRTKLN